VSEPGITEAFHDTAVWKDTYWLGVPTQKCPLDLWITRRSCTSSGRT
jgi:cephalosporin hydroxylase